MKVVKNKSISIILPCAGDGKRMGLSYPKELFEIFPGVKLIDFSLNHINYFAGRSDLNIKIITVIKSGKEEVYKYVKRKFPDIRVLPAFFNNKFSEWPGSVYSAYEHFSDINMVLLPDSFISMDRENIFSDGEGKGVIENSIEILNIKVVVFGIKKCSDPNILKNLGAVKIEGDKIEDFVDKPSDPEGLNGFWCLYGFRKKSGADLYKFLLGSVKKQRMNIKNESFYPPGFFYIDEYFDLGTNESVTKFRKKKN